MDKERTIKLSKQLYGLEPCNLNDLLQLLDNFLIEKGKERNKVNLFIKAVMMLPFEISKNYYLTALNYYITKYDIYFINKTNKVISIY